MDTAQRKWAFAQTPPPCPHPQCPWQQKCPALIWALHTHTAAMPSSTVPMAAKASCVKCDTIKSMKKAWKWLTVGIHSNTAAMPSQCPACDTAMSKK
eukprot:44742-Pelagomonas_calceolata.AAC.1